MLGDRIIHDVLVAPFIRCKLCDQESFLCDSDCSKVPHGLVYSHEEILSPTKHVLGVGNLARRKRLAHRATVAINPHVAPPDLPICCLRHLPLNQ